MTNDTEQLIQDGIAFYNGSEWEKAQKSFEEALSLDPENREANAFLGSVLTRVNKFHEASSYFGKADGDDPPREGLNREWGGILNDWGRTFLNVKDWNRAIEKFQKALECDTSAQHVYHYNWGLALEGLGQYEEALNQYQISVTADPSYANAYAAMGTILYRLKRPDEAAEKFQRVVDVDTASRHLHYRKWGDVLESQEENPNRYIEAAEKYELAIRENPSDPNALEALGRVLIKSGRVEEFQSIAKLAAKEDRYKSIRYAWSRHFANGKRYPEAVQEYQAALEIDGNYTDALNGLGNVHISLREFDEAIALFSKAVSVDPRYKYAYYNWGRALEFQGKYEEALKQYQAAVNADGKYAVAWNDWGRMLTELKKYDEAIEKFQKALELNPSDAHVYHLNWGVVLERLEQYEEALKQYQISVNANPKYAVAHAAMGTILYRLKRLDEAIRSYEKAVEVENRDANSHVNLGLALIYAGRYKEAEERFRKAIDLDPSLTGGHHNLAFLYEKLGRYEECQQKWKDALNAYLNIEEGKRTESDWSFIGQIQAAVFQRFEEGRKSIRTGLENFPESIDLLVPLVEINIELKDKYSYETPAGLEAIGSAHWEAWDAHQKLKSLLKKRMEKGESASDLALLGRTQKVMGGIAEAEKSLNEAIPLDPSLADALNDRAVIKAGREDFKGAIQDFEAAVNLEPHDFGYVSNLAEAYRKAKRFDEAEMTYQRILGIAPSHMDSLIGLGETYAAMGDAAKEGSHSADAEMMYQQAIEYFSKAIEIEERAERKKEGEPHTASKRLKPKGLSAVYYSRGYARVSLYDAQPRKSDLLLLQAQNDFRKVIKYEADKNFHKAKRALSKVLERLNPVSTRNIEQRTGPILISFLAFVLFVVSLFAFFKGRPEFASPGFALTDQTLQVLETANLPPEAVQGLNALVGREFSTQEGLLAAVKLITGEEVFQEYEQVLLVQPLEAPVELQWKPIEIGYFTLMAFGSLIFMVAGLYLQQISKFKFGSIEIEKSSVSQISSSGALGIRK